MNGKTRALFFLTLCIFLLNIYRLHQTPIYSISDFQHTVDIIRNASVHQAENNKSEVFYHNASIGNIIHSISNTTDKSVIPKRIWFTYEQDILSSKEPDFYYKNIMKTINIYRAFWKKPDAEAYVLDDKACIDILNEVDPELAHGFEREPYGPYKGDICRVGALYLYGGYYFDVDMEVVSPLKVPQEVTFATAIAGVSEYFFNSFMALTPKHPILITYIDILKAYYSKGDIGNCTDAVEKKILGPCMLFYAYKETKILKQENELLLQETGIKPNAFNDCGFKVFNPKDEETHFYSRIRGSNNCRDKTTVVVNHKNMNPKIPRTLWFINYEGGKGISDIFEISNVYRTYWNMPLLPIHVMNEDDCLEELKSAPNKLREAFMAETRIIFKKEYCAVWLLNLWGGYYFDTDMKIISDPIEITGMTFYSVVHNEIMPSPFMASVKEHPVLKQYLSFFDSESVEEISDRCHLIEKNNIMGSCLLSNAYNSLSELQRKLIYFVEQLELKNDASGYKYELFDKKKGVSLFHFMTKKEEVI